MGSTQFGNFFKFCHDSTLPICNLFAESPTQSRTGSQLGGAGFGGCALTGIVLKDGRNLANLGSILLCAIAILVTIGLILLSDRKKAAVGRREFQLFLVGYIIISICEIFTVGGFPLDRKVRLAFTAAHLGAITATIWVLFLNGLVGYQLLDDGTPISIGLVLLSATAFFVGTGYIALDTGFGYTTKFVSGLTAPNRNVALYVLYQLWPIICLVGFFLLETVLVLMVLGEKRPMVYLIVAAILFAIGQVFQYVISKYICVGTNGKIDGAFFETLFTLLAVVMTWTFWSSITEDDWPMPVSAVEPSYT